jgi:sugar phosphate isomerase/epimerase
LEFIDKAAKLGFDGVLLMAKRPHLSPLDVEDDELESILKALEENGIRLIGLAAYNDFLLQAPGEIPAAEMQLAYIESCARICSQLGGELVRVFSGYEIPDRDYSSQWDQVVTCLREAADRTARWNVSLAVQNHHTLAVDSELFRQLLIDVDRDNCRAGYDAWSPFLRGEDIVAGAGKLASRAIMSIAANYRTFPRYSYDPGLVNYQRVSPDIVRAVSMNAGDIDYSSFFKAMKAGGFSGWHVYEICSPVEGGASLANLDRKAKEFVDFITTLGNE